MKRRDLMDVIAVSIAVVFVSAFAFAAYRSDARASVEHDAVCVKTTLQDGSVQFPVGCGLGPSLDRLLRGITDDEVCDSVYDRYPHRIALRCWPRGHEPVLTRPRE